jgi:two-component system sensor kinase FixL
MLGEMVAGITHEITQPLTAIANFAGAGAAVLEQQPINLNELREYINEIRTQSSRTGKIVHSLRSLVRRSEIRREPSTFNDLVQDAIALIQADLRQLRVETRFNFVNPSPIILVDRVQVQQLIVNLVRNACEAMQSVSGRERTIVLHTRSRDKSSEFVCEDNGTGLPHDHEQLLFQPFFTTKPDGMGMGLAICRTIVEAHGGQIFADHKPGGGALLRVTLPVHENPSGGNGHA